MIGRRAKVFCLAKNLQRHVVEYSVAGDNVAAKDAVRAVPVGKATACFLDNGFQRRYVPGTNPVFDHELARALGHEHEPVKVAKAPLPMGADSELQKCLFTAGLDEPRKTGVEHLRVTKQRDIRDANALVAAIGAVA